MKLDALIVSVGCAETLSVTLPHNVHQCDRIVVVTTLDDLATQKVVRNCGAILITSSRMHHESASFNKGALANDGLMALRPTEWFLSTDADILLPMNLRGKLAGLQLDPVALYYTARYNLPDAEPETAAAYAADPAKIAQLPLGFPGDNRAPWGYFQLVHARYLSPWSEAFPSAGGVDKNFKYRWARKVVLDERDPSLVVLHIPHGDKLGARWNGPSLDGPFLWHMAGQVSGSADSHYRHLAAVNSARFFRLLRADTADSVCLDANQNPKGFALQRTMCGFWTWRLRSKPEDTLADGCGGWGMVSKGGVTHYYWAGQRIEPTGLEMHYAMGRPANWGRVVRS